MITSIFDHGDFYKVAYDNGREKVVPKDAQNADYVEAQEWAAIPGNAIQPAPGPTLAEAQAAGIAEVDRQCEFYRQEVAAPGSCQMAVYMMKESEARLAVEDIDADIKPETYPMMAAEVGHTINPATSQPTASISEMAAVVIAMADQWRSLAAATEGIRREAKLGIEQAADVAAVQAVLDALAWPAV